MYSIKSALVALGMLCATAIAAPVSATPQNYVALPTTSEINGRTFNLWFDRRLNTGWDLNYVLTAPGKFNIQSDGTASLMGSARSLTDPTSGFHMSFTFDSDFAYTPEFKPLFGAVEPTNNFFLDLNGGRLSGFGLLDGLELDVFRYPDPDGASTQIGGGLTSDRASNLHNRNFGMSSWFEITNIAEATCAICSNTSIQTLQGAQGDFIFDLVPAPVPLPASGLMLFGALGAAGFALRRRKA